jgi:hypothetical protein
MLCAAGRCRCRGLTSSCQNDLDCCVGRCFAGRCQN